MKHATTPIRGDGKPVGVGRKQPTGKRGSDDGDRETINTSRGASARFMRVLGTIRGFGRKQITAAKKLKSNRVMAKNSFLTKNHFPTYPASTPTDYIYVLSPRITHILTCTTNPTNKHPSRYSSKPSKQQVSWAYR